MNKYIKQLFAPEENTIVTTDVEPAISIDHTNRLVKGIESLQTLLGVTDMVPLAAGNTVKVYKQVKQNTPAQVGEGETIPLTQYKRTVARTIEMTLKKYRKKTTAEAIQRSGRDRAINETDDLLEREAQKEIKAGFFTELKTGAGTATAASTLQASLANLWAAMETYYEDIDVSPIYFVNPTDVADYLGTANITLQTTFGMSYVENFLGLGTLVVDSSVTAKQPIATAKENINGAYAPAGGDVAATFGLSYDESGLVGMKHYTADDEASVNTLIMSGAQFYCEDLSGVFKGTIGQ